MITDAKIGLTIGSMTHVEALASGTMRPPDMEYHPARATDVLANGQIRRMGGAWAEWHFTELTPAMVDALAAYCPNGSAMVYIRTRTNRNDDAYANFRAIMVWDEEESLLNFQRRRQKLTIRFYDLIPA